MSDGARRRGDADRSRAALLGAARELFAAHGYARTTVRAIAERAGVNQALLFRYFGSKDALFTSALGEEAVRLVASTSPGELLGTALRRMFADGPDGADALYAVLRSPEHPPALAALRDELAEPYRQAFTAWADAPGPDADLRAYLLLSWLLGLGFARSVLAVPALTEADGDVVVAHVERAARALFSDGRPGDAPVDGPADPA